MDFKWLITFGIGIAVYLAFLGLFALWKRHKNKKKFEEEMKEHEEENK